MTVRLTEAFGLSVGKESNQLTRAEVEYLSFLINGDNGQSAEAEDVVNAGGVDVQALRDKLQTMFNKAKDVKYGGKYP